jgi:hypothetical protein
MLRAALRTPRPIPRRGLDWAGRRDASCLQFTGLSPLPKRASPADHGQDTGERHERPEQEQIGDWHRRVRPADVHVDPDDEARRAARR